MSIVDLISQVHLPSSVKVIPRYLKHFTCSCIGVDKPLGSRGLKLPEILDNRHMNVVRLWALHTGRFYPQGHSAAGGIKQIKNLKKPHRESNPPPCGWYRIPLFKVPWHQMAVTAPWPFVLVKGLQEPTEWKGRERSRAALDCLWKEEFLDPAENRITLRRSSNR
jgi:hypothetical protein